MRRQTEYVHPRQHAIQGTMRRQTEYNESTYNTRQEDKQNTYIRVQHTIRSGTMRRQTEYVHPRHVHAIQGTMRRQAEYVHSRQHTIQGTM